MEAKLNRGNNSNSEEETKTDSRLNSDNNQSNRLQMYSVQRSES